MPHLPDRHTDHDLALVAASVTDDLTAAERTTVTELLAACAECTALQTDLRTLAAATASLPVPPRRRDYRITAEQAARLRPSGLRGILAAFGTKRFAFAAPLGTTMATLGLVGLLVAALPGPLAGGTALRAPDGGAGSTQIEAAPASGGDLPAEPTFGAPEVPAPGEDGTLAGTDMTGDSPFVAMAEELTQASGPDMALVVLAGAAVLLGLGLLAARWAGRRFA